MRGTWVSDPENNMKILLAGYFGSSNLGDEAILEALLSGIRKEYPDADITVLSAEPSETSAVHHVRSIHKYSFLRIIKALRNADAFILGGGGLIQDSTSGRSLRYYLFLISLAKHFGKKVILLGQGIGPVRNKKRLKKALSGVDLITVRDEDSLKFLTDIGVKAKKIVLSADLTFLLPAPSKEAGKKLLELEGIVKGGSRLVGISVREAVGGAKISEEEYRALAAMCDHLINEMDLQPVFLIFNYPDDLETSSRVMEHMKDPAHVVLRRCSPAEMLAVISNMDALIGMRLHSLIFSAIAKVPSFGLSYDPKVAVFQKIAGRAWINMSALDGKELASQIDSKLESPSMNNFEVEALEKKAAASLKYLSECLKDNRIDVLGIGVDNLTMNEAVDRVEILIKSGGRGMIVTPNPEMIMAAQTDMELKELISKAALAPADGVGLMMAGRILRKRFKERVPGIDLMMNIAELSRSKGYRLFLLGGAEGVAEAAAKNMNANVVGTMHGFSKNDQMMIDAINEAKPDILFIGMGSSRQEKWAAKHMKELNVRVIMGIGGSLDVISGKLKRAPKFMRRAGFEWLWRLISEPSRAGRMKVLPKFLMKVVRKRVGGK